MVIATPAPTVADLVRQAAELGCGGCIVYAAGFAEIGRTALQQELVDAAGQMPIIGPNGNGVVAVSAKAPMWGDATRLPRAGGDIGLITESGNIGVIALGHRQALGLHTVVSTGNSANVSAPEVLQHLASTAGIAAVALYLESDGDGQQWCQALAACAENEVRVVVLKAGRSARGAAVGQAHTAAIVGDHGVFAALIREAGGILVNEAWQLLETARALACGRRDARGAAIVTCSGADAAIGADLAADLQVRLTDFTPGTVEALRAVLPDGATPANPLDHTALLWADVAALAQVTEAIGAQPEVGHLIYVQDEPDGLTAEAMNEWARTRQGALLGAMRSGQTPLLVASTAGQAPAGAVEGLGNALRAIQVLQQPAPQASRLQQIGQVAATTVAPGHNRMNEHQAKQLAARYGISVPEGAPATDAPSAVDLARRLDWPVVLKALDPDLAHKSGSGGVVIGLTTGEQVHRAAGRLLASAPAVLVEPQVPAGIEVLVSARRDGVVPTLTIGLGGIWAEALADVVVIPLPAAAERICTELGRLAAAPVFTGARGQQPVDLEGLCMLAERIAHMMVAEQLSLVEANPVIVGPSSAIAVDLLVR